MEFLTQMQEVWSFYSVGEADTVNLGRALAQISVKGDIYALFGTLGMGKSVLSRAFVQYFQGEVEVPSPTFTLLQTYETPDFDIYHFDLYRLKSPEEIFELGMEEAMYEGVCLIEWPEKMGSYLPKRAITVKITPEGSRRRFAFFAEGAAAERLLLLKDKL